MTQPWPQPLPRAPFWCAVEDANGSRRIAVVDPGAGPMEGARWTLLEAEPHSRGHERELLASEGLSAAALKAALAGGTEPLPTDAPTFLPPVAEPRKIICVAKNYLKHAQEFGAEPPAAPVFFAKLTETLIGAGAAIELPRGVDSRIDHEAELALVLGFDDPDRRGRKHIHAAEALDLVAGFTICNDVTARTLQGEARKLQYPWLRAKSFDTFCPIGPYVVPRDSWPHLEGARITCTVNDAMRQDASTKDMVFGIPELLASLSTMTTLRPGDIIATGTPEGVERLQAGDIVTVSVEGLGTLENSVIRET